MEPLSVRFMRDAGFGSLEVRYAWDDWNVEAVEATVDPDLSARVSQLSLRANIAFTFGCTEWLVSRFDGLFDDPLPSEAIEAAWAQIVDFRYAVPWNPFDDNWSGPVLGPIKRAMMWLRVVVQLASERSNNARCPARMSKLTEYVMANQVPFVAWRESVLARLTEYYQLDPDEPVGEVVPREALNPDLSFTPDQTEAIVNSFLHGLDYDDNGFLCTPDEMRQAGFTGTPYEFDIRIDRRNRPRKR